MSSIPFIFTFLLLFGFISLPFLPNWVWILLIIYMNIDLRLCSFVDFIMKYMKIKHHINYSMNVFKINEEKRIIMANHYNGCDYAVIFKTFKPITEKNIYTVAKATAIGGSEEKNLLNMFLGLFKKFWFYYFNLISHTRGDKDSGIMVKNKIVETLNNGDTVLIFPEGTTTRDGRPRQFRKGIFELCVIENIKVIPVTIKYNRDIGMDFEHPLKFSEWYDIKADVYIHEEIYDSDSEIFMQKVFDKISEPYVIK